MTKRKETNGKNKKEPEDMRKDLLEYNPEQDPENTILNSNNQAEDSDKKLFVCANCGASKLQLLYYNIPENLYALVCDACGIYQTLSNEIKFEGLQSPKKTKTKKTNKPDLSYLG